MPPIQLASFNEPLADLGADAAGPYWLFHRGPAAVVFDAHGQVATYPCEANPQTPVRFVAGTREPLCKRADGSLWAGANRLDLLGNHMGFEEFAAAHVLPIGTIARAFAAESAGLAWVAYEAPGSDWLRVVSGDPAMWAPRSSVAGDWVAFGWRGHKGIVTSVDTMDHIVSRQYQPRETVNSPLTEKGHFLGDPAIAVKSSGAVSYAACEWFHHRGIPDYSHQLRTVWVDNKPVVTDAAVQDITDGQTTRRQWIPSIAMGPRGIVLAWQSGMVPNGPDEVSVGIVRDGAIVGGSVRRVPGFGGMVAVAPDGKVYVGTDRGVWGNAP